MIGQEGILAQLEIEENRLELKDGVIKARGTGRGDSSIWIRSSLPLATRSMNHSAPCRFQ